jgi:hypothetical protein
MDGLEVESEHHPVFLLLEDLMRDKQYAESMVPKQCNAVVAKRQRGLARGWCRLVRRCGTFAPRGV